MGRVGSWLDALPLAPLLVVALILGLAPFVPEPHLLEKIRMLATGTLVRSIDIFDLVYHGAPLIVLLLKLIRLTNRWQAHKE
ncbi:MAG: RND transporter [Candidatus Electrothrix sp. GM3_4]|nr:RND transporter [Candidatus Electrothrix sp. GM3_4]